ncbi:hypothetical protein GLYMA_13G321800v4 [Glycine max]|uniref:C2H2-type domain-containing protein n=1 Tax=Glycine max TaxID=3847 RepID=A0A0R0H715_SOYBN|nr:hypothetical protein GYH30_038035 [Glycine max]KRH22821.1 hypothetical protein GLYMA_13G321800v4 [Glycine max]
MISRATSSFPSVHHQGLQMFPDPEGFVSPSEESGSSGVILSPNQSLPEPTSMAISSMNSIIQEIIVTATSMMFTCQQMALTTPPGFERDANLRMHMRAHGDEYKTNAALSNPIKNKGNLLEGGRECLMSTVKPKYSCPQEGCRWNQRHVKFQPLKSMICAKNHYKRSHCPKMYVCKRCNQKQFSVLSDLRTHEKHCGDLKWQCTCGTSFSRKDKLMGHVALFVGHQPAAAINNSNALSFSAKLEQQHTLQM